ncbi:hypothetical protein GUJ93_ZPchr0001g32575 [Zizania palustris]|uniref:Uncharacterized protein n=1 Tax=Zizania palustris TaxID=103762 RepID=A0A8J5VL85_ZIZPA|nr:hypothetical protein GUJ93_ZPchr0001g32575 [Zizania palustris]
MVQIALQRLTQLWHNDSKLFRQGCNHFTSTLDVKCYLDKLENQGFEVLHPDKTSLEHTVLPAMSAFRRGDMEGARNLLRISLQIMLVRAVNTIILASDDFVGILPDDDPLLKKCIDPMDALALQNIHSYRTPTSCVGLLTAQWYSRESAEWCGGGKGMNVLCTGGIAKGTRDKKKKTGGGTVQHQLAPCCVQGKQDTSG